MWLPSQWQASPALAVPALAVPAACYPGRGVNYGLGRRTAHRLTGTAYNGRVSIPALQIGGIKVWW
jgi:hypothetical protein